MHTNFVKCQKYNIDDKIRFILMFFCIYLFLFCFYSLFDASFFVINFRGLSLFLISLVITEIMFSIYDRKHGFDVNIQNPKSFYGLFYLLYYVLPYLFAFTRHSLPLRNEFFIAIILSAGYFAWSLGIKFSGLGKVEYRANINLSLIIMPPSIF